MISNKPHTIVEVLLKLHNYCVYQERCLKEVRQKLKEMRINTQMAEKIIMVLQEDNILNEERFAKTFVSGKFKIKKWGKYRLTSELKKRNISGHNINLAIREISDSEYFEVFNDLARKKTNSISENNKMKKRKKLIDYLLYRGWESEMVYAKANELIP
jgi:regulatory protein